MCPPCRRRSGPFYKIKRRKTSGVFRNVLGLLGMGFIATPISKVAFQKKSQLSDFKPLPSDLVGCYSETLTNQRGLLGPKFGRPGQPRVFDFDFFSNEALQLTVGEKRQSTSPSTIHHLQKACLVRKSRSTSNEQHLTRKSTSEPLQKDHLVEGKGSN